jgi:hypothetical protein
LHLANLSKLSFYIFSLFIDRNAPLINGLTRSPFFSYASYLKYSVPPEAVVTGGQKKQPQQKCNDSAAAASCQSDPGHLANNEPVEKSPCGQSTGSHATSATACTL